MLVKFRNFLANLPASLSWQFTLFCCSFLLGVLLATLTNFNLLSLVSFLVCLSIISWLYQPQLRIILIILAILFIGGFLRRELIEPARPKNLAIQARQNADLNQSSIKRAYLNSLQITFPEPAAGLIAGLTAGGLSGLDKSWQQKFRATGTTHLVALSGYNVAIVVNLFMYLLSFIFVPRRYRLWSVGLLLIFFCFIVGAEASLIRASIMGLLVALSQHLGRPYTARTILPATAALMLAQDPLILTDIGWQLSFLATIGILVAFPLLNALVPTTKFFGKLREAFLMSIAAELCVLPLILYIWGIFSALSPVTNALVALLIPVTMLFGFIGGLVGFISPQLGFLLGLPGWLGAELVLHIIDWFSAWPISLKFMALSPPALIIMYIALGGILWGIKVRLTNHQVRL